MREQTCEGIIDELVFVARASEGSISLDWLMHQPIAIRRKYVESFQKEIKEREKKLKKSK